MRHMTKLWMSYDTDMLNMGGSSYTHEIQLRPGYYLKIVLSSNRCRWSCVIWVQTGTALTMSLSSESSLWSRSWTSWDAPSKSPLSCSHRRYITADWTTVNAVNSLYVLDLIEEVYSVKSGSISIQVTCDISTEG